jgi:predicted nucleic acid-binding protein
MNGKVVVDASLFVALFVRDPFTPKASALARRWADQGTVTVAPHFMPAEVANAIYKRHLRGEFSLEEASSLMDTFMVSGVQLMAPTSLYSRALQLASELKQSTVYDTLYLALAQHLDSELWTADQRFYKAAASEFPNIRWIGDFSLSL